MKPFIFGDWHAWEGTVGILLSFEPASKLRQFDDVNACIDWLYVNGHTDAARALNAHIKGA